MKLEIKPLALTDEYTISELYINNVYFCDTLEDAVRPEKIVNETAIPEGTYKVVVNHSNRFNMEMPLLLDVPNYKGIRIHSGNTQSDTSGCLLVGFNEVKGKVIKSIITFKKLMELFEQSRDVEHSIIIKRK